MSDEAAPGRITVIWAPKRGPICARDRARSRDANSPLRGGVKKFRPPRTGFRLRCGDYRVFFDQKGESAIEITGVKNRCEAYW
jgi:mRNA-degrading endonuclease RelE of RelBE toxin-antitoxin system